MTLGYFILKLQLEKIIFFVKFHFYEKKSNVSELDSSPNCSILARQHLVKRNPVTNRTFTEAIKRSLNHFNENYHFFRIWKLFPLSSMVVFSAL